MIFATRSSHTRHGSSLHINEEECLVVGRTAGRREKTKSATASGEKADVLFVTILIHLHKDAILAKPYLVVGTAFDLARLPL